MYYFFTTFRRWFFIITSFNYSLSELLNYYLKRTAQRRTKKQLF